MSVLYIIFYDTLAPFAGELNISNPFVMVSLNSPSIAGIIIYFIYGGFQGMESFLKCLIPNKKECIWFPILFGLSLLFYLCMHFGSKYFGILSILIFFWYKKVRGENLNTKELCCFPEFIER